MRKIIQTTLRQLWSARSTGTPNFVPVTGPVNATLVRGVRVAWELEGVTPNIEVQPAYQMSDDGITWSATITGMVGAYSSTTGWSYEDATVTVSTDIKNFVRFGFLVRNTSGTDVEMGQGALRLTIGDVAGQSFVVGPVKVWSNGTPTQIFHPLIGPMPVSQVDSYRGSLELQADSGDAQVQLGYQVSDDRLTWYSGASMAAAGTFATFGTERTSSGITYASTFSTLSLAEPRQWIRWGVACRSPARPARASTSGARDAGVPQSRG